VHQLRWFKYSHRGRSDKTEGARARRAGDVAILPDQADTGRVFGLRVRRGEARL
jgi:hypothetical protein